MYRIPVSLLSIFCFTLLTLSGCRSFYVGQTGADRINTAGLGTLDSSVIQIVEPYKKALEASMNIVIAELETDLVKEQPESNLGNHLAQITLESAESSTGEPIDFAIMNYGGMRVPLISAGPLQVNDAYQVMPFDNYIVVMKLKGEVIQRLLNKIAANGGWPVEGVRFTIEGGKATNVTIGKDILDISADYSMAITDYLANGGDYLNLLKEHTYMNTGVLLRDAIIESWKNTTADGQAVNVKKDGRVITKENE